MAKGKARPFYLLYGDEGYLIERVREKIIDTLLPRCRELNFTSYDADQTRPSEVINACNTLPCMAQRRIVLVKAAHQYSKSDLRSFSPYLQSPSPTTSLIFIAEEMPAEFLREVKDGAFHLKRPSQTEIIHWIRTIAQELDKEISSEAARYLQEAVGSDLQGLYNELSKASLYIGDRGRIELKDVERVVSEVRATTIFELTKALGERDLKRAFRSLERIWESGEHPLKILAMISRQFRHLLMTKEVLAKGGGTEEVKKQLGISNPYYLRELAAQAKGFSQPSLQRALTSLWETDLKLKRSSLPRRLLLEELIIKLSASS
ncbi:MAG: DNA polymerase III subunit delta [Deltaproteobacteria bacterium RBG_13_52_11]|nr:MAG: DNA polymerase III subunit delta [Deltaproteobacteria bacterium RBG_13_52_11]